MTGRQYGYILMVDRIYLLGENKNESRENKTADRAGEESGDAQVRAWASQEQNAGASVCTSVDN